MQTRVLPPDREPPPLTWRLNERDWSFRSVIAVALVSLIIGGLGGAGLASVGQDDDERHLGPGHGRLDKSGRDGPLGMDKRRPDRMKQWHQQRGLGQRQWGQDGTPGVPPSRQPKPSRPTPLSPTPTA